jgi:hypothetical protein
MDFTLAIYKRLLDELLNSFPSGDYRVASQPRSSRRCIVRHDVDRWPRNALTIASIERSRGISTSYYFRSREIHKNPELIQRIAQDGHEIGYHYEVLARSNGDFDKAHQLFEDDLTQLREIGSVKSVAMHGSPLSKHTSMDFWNQFALKDFDLDAEAFRLIDAPHWSYLTDTGRSWSTESPNIRDRAASSRTLPGLRSTLDLLSRLDEIRGNLCLVVHPERWNRVGVHYSIAWSRDILFNVAKRGLVILRRGSI